MSEITANLDRRITEATSGVSASYAAGVTTWTLPYAVATDGSEGTLCVVKASPWTVLETTRPAANQVAYAGGNLVGVPVYIGIIYPTTSTLSRLYQRDKDDKAETRGNLTLRYLTIFYEDTTDLTVTVASTGRASRTYTLAYNEPTSGKLQVPLLGRNDELTITLSSTGSGTVGFSGLDWEGTYHVRNQRQ